MAVIPIFVELLARATPPPEPIGDGPSTSVTSENRGPILLGSSIALMVIMVIVMITRIYCRAVLLKKMGSDDWCMLVSATLAVGLVINNCLSVRTGTGRHQWIVPWQDGVTNQKLAYAGQILYFLALGFCKASLLLFIIRLQPSGRMVLLSWSILCFCSAFTVAAFISSCLQCFPVEYLWNQLDPELTGNFKHTCVNQKALQFSLPSINMFSDLVVWLLPIKMVWKVQLPIRQKWGLIAVFSLGGIGVLAGAFRLWSVSKAIGSADGSWDNLDMIMWSSIEVLVSIIFGSAPAVKPFFSKYLPSILGASTFRSRSYSHSANRPTNNNNTKKSRLGRSRGEPNGYALDSVSRTGNSSTEEFSRGQVVTRIEAPGMGDAESEEYRGRELDGIVKSTDVQVLVEERV